MMPNNSAHQICIKLQLNELAKESNKMTTKMNLMSSK